jgi:hypothetical protein
LKKLAARDLEDILQVCNFHTYAHLRLRRLQCAIPVFDGLFPEPHNTAVLSLLFICAHWHGMAKLSMHTDDTLTILDNTTTELGVTFRSFNETTCPNFDTRELARETNARKRRRGKKQPDLYEDDDDEPLRKTLNIQTYKYHALGDYVAAIRQYGTTDSFSTERVRLFTTTCHSSH